MLGLLTFLDKRTGQNLKMTQKTLLQRRNFALRTLVFFVGSIDHIMMDSYGRSVVWTSQVFTNCKWMYLEWTLDTWSRQYYISQ